MCTSYSWNAPFCILITYCASLTGIYSNMENESSSSFMNDLWRTVSGSHKQSFHVCILIFCVIQNLQVTFAFCLLNFTVSVCNILLLVFIKNLNPHWAKLHVLKTMIFLIRNEPVTYQKFIYITSKRVSTI